jgi:hypothetical protein
MKRVERRRREQGEPRDAGQRERKASTETTAEVPDPDARGDISGDAGSPGQGRRT